MAGLISQAVRVIHETDPKDAIFEQLAGLYEDVRVGGADVLVAVYRREGRTRGGIYLADKTKDEDDFQGISALVLKLGPYAYQTEKTRAWFVDADGNPDPPKPGDWVLFDTKFGFAFKLGTRTCRLIDDQHIMGILPMPDEVA